jgi:hypothetical protein
VDFFYIDSGSKRWILSEGNLGFNPDKFAAVADTDMASFQLFVATSIANIKGIAVLPEKEVKPDSEKTEEELIEEQVEGDPNTRNEQEAAPWVNKWCKACKDNVVPGLNSLGASPCNVCVLATGIQPADYTQVTQESGIITWKEKAEEKPKPKPKAKAPETNRANLLEEMAGRVMAMEQLTFEDLAVAMPTPPEVIKEDKDVIRFLELMFEDEDFVGYLENLLVSATITTPDVLFREDEHETLGFNLPTILAEQEMQELARIIMVSARWICTCRVNMENLITQANVIDLDPIGLDAIMCAAATAIQSCSIAELDRIKVSKLKDFLKIREWSGTHLMDLLMKANMD